MIYNYLRNLKNLAIAIKSQLKKQICIVWFYNYNYKIDMIRSTQITKKKEGFVVNYQLIN